MTADSPVMDQYDIQAALKRKGYTQQKVAKSLSPPVNRATVSLVIARRGTSNRVREKIAEILEKPFCEIWGTEPDSP